MAHKRNKLTALAVRKETRPGRYCDGGNLHFFIGKNGARAWVFRFRSPVTGQSRDMGLGNVADVTLERARERAAAARVLMTEGIDPLDHARKQRSALRATRMTFGQCASAYIAAHKAGWRNAKHAQQWSSTLATHAAPINGLAVDSIDTAAVLACIEPQWPSKTETMTRVRQRIECVLDWATARKLRTGENPARWRGHLDKLLPKRSKVQAVEHRPALPYADIAEFMATLKTRQALAARVLHFQILTASRPGEAAGAQWNEIDLDARTWTIPASRMKAGREHRVPLSAPALALLRSLPQVDGNVFPGVKGKPVTTAASMKLLKAIHPGVSAHGFRSTFRDWAGETTTHPREVIEHALAHGIKDKAEAAYQRGDLFDRRARLMNGWARFCEGERA
ncbi:MAG: tyrosine-type recombinase/integrase [Lysobacterales bacterium]